MFRIPVTLRPVCSTAHALSTGLFVGILLAAASHASETGELDLRFNATGTPGSLQIGEAADDEEVLGVVADEFDGIYVARIAIHRTTGSAETVIQRYSSTGQLDLSFGTAGSYVASATPDYGLLVGERHGGLAVGPDRLVVTYAVGERIYVEVLDWDGVTLAGAYADWDLITDGDDTPLDVAMCGSTQIVVVGSAETATATDAGVAVFEFDEGGARGPSLTLDTSFNATGLYTVGWNAPTVTTDSFDGVACHSGKIHTAGTVFRGIGFTDGLMVRFTSTGSLDSSFDGDGIALYSRGGGPPVRGLLAATAFEELLIGSTGDIYATGSGLGFAPSFVAKIQVDGALDTSFGSGGYSDVGPFTIGATASSSFTVPVGVFEVAGNILMVGEAADVIGAQIVRGVFYAAMDRATGAPVSRWGGARGYEIAEELAFTWDAAVDSDGNLIALSSFGDTQVEDRQAHLLKIFGGIFTDGFESGDLTAW